MRCPECNSRNLEELDEGVYYCNDCGLNINMEPEEQEALAKEEEEQ
jgi:ribosomal protein L37AE/L43A